MWVGWGIQLSCFTALVRSYGLRQEFITPHKPRTDRLGRAGDPHAQEAMRAPAESLPHARRLIGAWIPFHNHWHPYQALNTITPTEAFALAVNAEVNLTHFALGSPK